MDKAVREGAQVTKLRWFAAHTRITSRGGMEAEARAMEDAANTIAALERRIESLLDCARERWPDVTTLESAWDRLAEERNAAESRLSQAEAERDGVLEELAAWHELVTMAHINRDGLWPNNWPQNVAWIAYCLHTGSVPPTLTDAARAAGGREG